MFRVSALLLAALALVLPGTAALAQPGARVVSTVSWVEEWDPATQQWIRVADEPAAIVTETPRAEPVRFIAAAPRRAAAEAGVARFGPFRVLDAHRAAIVGATDDASPAAFAAMLAAFPQLDVLEFADAPGTSNDLANLAVGRAIRKAGLATAVPDGGSARSGAVELFLAGTRRSIAPGALFAVHSWRDEAGREPRDFAPDAPANRLYIDYFTEMGMSLAEARAFYAMTNSVPHAGALWLDGREMARWIAPEAAPHGVTPGEAEPALRHALARSGSALAAALRGALAVPHVSFAAPGDALAPQLAYADAASGLLDSVPAFP
jgi:hypothetical protein